MAFGRMGGLNKWFGYTAFGFALGFITSLVSGLLSSVTSFLPGFLGTIVNYALLGWLVLMVASLIMRIVGARRR